MGTAGASVNEDPAGKVNVASVILSLQCCCATFAEGGTGLAKKAALPAMVGFAVPRDGAGSPVFGVSAAGVGGIAGGRAPQVQSPLRGPGVMVTQRQAVAESRLQEFVGAARGDPTVLNALNALQAQGGIRLDNYWCGNCAEQMFWPRKGSRPTPTDGRCFKMNRTGPPQAACRNCQSTVKNVLAPRGFRIRDLHAPVPTPPAAIEPRVPIKEGQNPRVESRKGAEWIAERPGRE
jgi:hypothetical protein